MFIRGQNSESLEIHILRRSHPHAHDYWDGNWLDAQVKINVVNFEAHYTTSLRVDDFMKLYDQIILLQNRTHHEAQFTTLEHSLYINLKVQKNGILSCTGIADDLMENRLEFYFTADNMELDYLLEQLKEILKKYPLIGQP